MKELFAAFTRNSPLAPLWPLCVPAIQLGSSSSGLPQGTLPEPEAQVCYLGLHLLAQSGDCLALSATQLRSTVGSHVWWYDIFFSFQALPGNQVLRGLQIHGVKTWYTEIRNPVTRNQCAALCKWLIKPSPPLLLSKVLRFSCKLIKVNHEMKIIIFPWIISLRKPCALLTYCIKSHSEVSKCHFFKSHPHETPCSLQHLHCSIQVSYIILTVHSHVSLLLQTRLWIVNRAGSWHSCVHAFQMKWT